MFRFAIDHETYSCPTRWQELPVSDAVKLQALVKELPDAVADHFRSLVGPAEEVTPVQGDDVGALLDFWRKALHALSGCPLPVLDKTADTDVHALGEHCLTLFVFSLLAAPLYHSEGIEAFNTNGERLVIPATGTDALGNAVPLERITAKEFCDASDITATGDLTLAPLLLAVLCRPDGEPYDEEGAKTRARKMGDVPMSIYLEVYTRLMEMHAYLRGEFPKLYGSDKGGDKSSDDPYTWSDKLLFVADDKPSELPYAEGLNAYEFVRILDAKLKREKQKWEIVAATRGF